MAQNNQQNQQSGQRKNQDQEQTGQFKKANQGPKQDQDFDRASNLGTQQTDRKQNIQGNK